MEYNFVTNIQTCFELVRDTVNLPLIYYSHIPAATVSLLIGILVYAKSRNLLAKILFAISITFSFWVICSFITWTSYNSLNYMFFWSFFGILISVLSVLCLYLTYVFINNKDVSCLTKFIWLALLVPVLMISPTKYNLPTFDGVWCVPTENNYFDYYFYFLGAIAFVGILLFFIKKIKANITNKKELILFVVGVECFLFLFLFLGFINDYLVNNGYITNYNIEFYGLFGMVIFMAFLSFLIVRFKAFDIKLVGAQALVWALVIAIGSEFMFVDNLTSQILVGVTLVISSILGLFLVKSVKKEVALREELEIANNNQEALIHFITHQVKGFFTKSKMIFAGLLEGDFGEVSTEVKEVAETGLESDKNAVMMVQNILSASNLKSGKVELNLEEIDFTSLVKEIAGDFTDVIKNKNLTYNIDIPNEKISVLADRIQITQAIKNLIDNSVRYTPTGEVKVSLKKIKGPLAKAQGKDALGKEQVIFEVSDTGVGLSDSDKKKLFTEGGKGDEARKTNTDSTGFGLYIVKKIVDKHNGHIWAQSLGRGHGSHFFISLLIK